MLVNKNIFHSALGILKQATVEPFVFLFMLGFFTRFVSYQSILTEKSCVLLLNYSETICQDLENHPTEQVASAKIGNNIYLGTMLITTIPSFIVSMFLGPWSDIYGRRYNLILSSSGILITGVIAVIITSLPTASPYLFLACEIPGGLGGGMLVCLSSTYSYMSDITNERTRSTRYAILEFFLIIAMPLGTIIGGQAYALGGYLAVMITGTCGILASLLWVIFLVKESKMKKENFTRMDIFRDLFRFDNVAASVRTCTQPRPGNLRMQIWLLVVVSCTQRFIAVGTLSVGFPFARLVFGWTVDEYSNVITVFYAIDGIATLTLVPMINRKFLLHEAALGLIGTFSYMAKMVLLAVSFKQGIFYYAWCSGMLGPCLAIAVRSRMSKLVSKEELGRVFALVATCESLTPVIGTTAMLQLYNASAVVYPGLPFAFSALLLVPSAIIFCWLTTLPTMSFSEYKEEEEVAKMKELKDVSSFK